MQVASFNKWSFIITLTVISMGLTACPHIAYQVMKENLIESKSHNAKKRDYSQNKTARIDISSIVNATTPDSLTPEDAQYSDSVTLDYLNQEPTDEALKEALRDDHKLQSVFDNDFNLPDVQTKHNRKSQSNSNRYTNIQSIDASVTSSNSDTNNVTNTLSLRPQPDYEVQPWKMEIKSINTLNYPKTIEMRIQIMDSSGRTISGMAPPNYKGQGDWKSYWHMLSDSCGRVNQIDDFFVEEVTQKSNIQNAFAFVLDHSGSMGYGKIQLLNKGLARILTALKRQDYVSVIKFAKKTFTQIPLSNDKKHYVTTFRDQLDSNFDIGSGTRMYDALHVGINELKKAPDTYRRNLVLLSDGFDGSGKNVLDSVVKMCKANRISITTIDFNYDNELMKEVAKYTGGTYYKIFSIKEFPFVFRDLYFSLNNYYLLRYTAPECAGVHKINIEVQVPNMSYLKAHDSTYYDKSIITKFDAAGTTAMLNIGFATGSATLSDTSRKEINQIFQILQNNPDLKLAIHGHTDNIGSDVSNLELSANRAISVKSALVKLGIDPRRLSTKGFGENKPLAPNDTEHHRQLNRRTEFVVVENE